MVTEILVTKIYLKLTNITRGHKYTSGSQIYLCTTVAKQLVTTGLCSHNLLLVISPFNVNILCEVQPARTNVALYKTKK